MKTTSNYKDMALESLKGKWDKGIIAALIYLVAATVPMLIIDAGVKNAGNIWSFVVIPLGWGYAVYHLAIIRNGDLSYERLFDGYKDFARIFLTQLLVFVYTLLWCLLFLIPGCIKAYSYGMTSYILKDDPTIKNNEAIEKSMKMMDGHKMDLFLLDLSFIGWAILAIIPAGLGIFVLYPYWQTTRAHFYEDLKAETAEQA